MDLFEAAIRQTCEVRERAAMPRYYFHLRGPDIGQYIADPAGHLLWDVASLKRTAGETARHLLDRKPLTSWSGWTFEIVDEDGQTALILPFRQILPHDDDPEPPPPAPRFHLAAMKLVEAFGGMFNTIPVRPA